jgi:nucleoid-associated protein YgaU
VERPAEPVAVLDDDALVLRLGLPGGRPGPAPAASAEAPPATPPATPPGTPPPGAAGAPVPETYVVQPGDTLSEIAERLLGSASLADGLARLNGLHDPSALRAGQVLRLR